jgi:hypothetical protein
LKKIKKRVGTDYQVALDLFDTGIYDAMYLAGMVVDDAKMTKADLNRWAKTASAPIAGSIVPAVAAHSRYGWELGMEWIESAKPLVAVAGWGTLMAVISITDDDELNLDEVKRLLKRVEKTIDAAPNAVRYQMNAFVIAAGCYVRSLMPLALELGEKLGRVSVDMGNTACQVPYAPDYIRKAEKRGAIGKKRKSAKC